MYTTGKSFNFLPFDEGNTAPSRSSSVLIEEDYVLVILVFPSPAPSGISIRHGPKIQE